MTFNEIKILSKGYVDSIKRSNAIYDACKKYDLYIENEHDPLIEAAERLLNESTKDEYFVDSLCSFAIDGYIDLINPEEKITDFDTLIDALTERVENNPEAEETNKKTITKKLGDFTPSSKEKPIFKYTTKNVSVYAEYAGKKIFYAEDNGFDSHDGANNWSCPICSASWNSWEEGNRIKWIDNKLGLVEYPKCHNILYTSPGSM